MFSRILLPAIPADFPSRFASLLLLATVLPAAAAPPEGDWAMVWNDEFSGTAMNPAKWSHRQLGVRNMAVNTADAVSVADGNLTIRTATVSGTNYTGMISTGTTYLPAYGYVEARIDFDGSPGSWSAFWLQSPSVGNPIGDPHNAGVEIDVIEHRKVNTSNQNIESNASINLHWDGYAASHKHVGTEPTGLNLGTGYHLYGVEWTPTVMRFFIDGVLRWTVNDSTSTPVPRRPEEIILSSEVNSGSWAGTIPSGGYGNWAASTTKMKVDWVRVYQRNSTLYHGNFDHTGPWKFSSGASREESAGSSGSSVLTLTKTNSTPTARQSLYGLEPDGDYIARAALKAEDAAAPAELSIINAGLPDVQTTSPATTWTTVGLPFKTGRASRTATLSLSQSTVGASSHADDVTVGPRAAFDNPLFERGDWEPYTHYGAAALVQQGARSGSRAISFTGTAGQGVAQEIHGLKPGTSYLASAWAKTGTAPGRFRVSGTGISGGTAINLSGAGYTRHQIAFATDAGTTDAKLDLWFNAGTPAASILIDDLFLAEPLPPVWTVAEPGTPTLSGEAGMNDSTVVLRASGKGFGGTADQGRLLCQPLTGDGEIVARLRSTGGRADAAIAGIMLRESANDPGAPEVFLGHRNDGSLESLRRNAAGAFTASTRETVPGFGWLKIRRIGNTVRSFHSAEGTAWEEFGSAVVRDWPQTLQACLAASSCDPANFTEARFADVVIHNTTEGWPAEEANAVSVSASDAAAGEGSGVPVSFVLTRTGALGQALTVSYSLEGTATNGVDYSATSTSVVIPADKTSAEVMILPVNDDFPDGDKTVTLVISPAAGYVPGPVTRESIAILDDERLFTIARDSFDDSSATHLDDAGDPDDLGWTTGNGTPGVIADSGTNSTPENRALAIDASGTFALALGAFPRQQLEAGDSLTVSFTFRHTGSPPDNSGGLRFGLAASPDLDQAFYASIGTGSNRSVALTRDGTGDGSPGSGGGATALPTSGSGYSGVSTTASTLSFTVLRTAGGYALTATINGHSYMAESETGWNGFDRVFVRNGSISTSFRIDDVIVSKGRNGSPAFTAEPLLLPAADAGEDYEGSLAGAAEGDGPLVFSKTEGPEWLHIMADGALSGTPGATDAGANHFRVRATDIAGRSIEATMAITVTYASPSDAWRQLKFGGEAGNPAIAGDNADPDGDGMPNLTEYALGRDPMGTDAPFPFGVADDEASLTYTLDPSATDVSVTPEWSDDLITWNDEGLTREDMGEAGPVRVVRVSVNAEPAREHLFLRLKVSRL